MFIFIVAVLVGWSPSGLWAQTAELPPQVDELYQKFFALADQGQLKQTYELLAPLVKAIDTPDLWYGHMASERESMGEARNRVVLQTETVDKFGDLPKNKYLKVVFKTEFPKYGDGVEILIFHQGENGQYGLAGYKIEYNRWPEAVKLIGNGLLLVFFIMGLLAVMTWGVGRVVRMTDRKKPVPEEKKG
jgi:hypothetical protein